MRPWLMYALLALLCWGVWGFLSKMASRTLDTRSLFLICCFASVVINSVILFFCFKDFSFNWKVMNHNYAFLSVMVAIGGTLLYFLAISKTENLTAVTVVAALYPVVTMLLSTVFLKEEISAQKLIGLVLCVLGVVFLTVEKRLEENKDQVKYPDKK